MGVHQEHVHTTKISRNEATSQLSIYVIMFIIMFSPMLTQRDPNTTQDIIKGKPLQVDASSHLLFFCQLLIILITSIAAKHHNQSNGPTDYWVLDKGQH